MLSSFRSAMLVLAALSASSVAPAQVGPMSGARLPVTNASLPKIVDPRLLIIDGPVAADPLAPAPDAPDASTAPPADAARPSADLPTMVARMRASEPGSRELECLATGIYFESKSEPLGGQLAVGEVIANRAGSHGRFPSSYCGVLFQHGQFSFIRGGHLPAVPRSSRQWQTAVAVAQIVDRDLKDSAAPNALFFHAKRVSPGWHLKRVASIGNHIFYR
jgi:spore germination cell wall hydrolase CwlJ-like protein